MGTALVGFLVLALMVGLGVLFGVLHFRERNHWRIWSHARRWQFIDSWPQMRKAFTGGPFGRGSSRKASFGFSGTFDTLPVSGFRYQYTTGSDDSRTTHRYQVLRCQVPRATFPFLTLSHENFISRALSNDIQFEDAAFNRAWHVRSANPRFAHDVIHPRTMEFLKGLDVPKLETIWFEQDSVLISLKGNIDTDAVDAYLRLLTQLVSRTPPFVLQNVGHGRLEIEWNGPGVTAQEQAARMAELRDKK